MSSSRVFLCDLCIILLFGLYFVLAGKHGSLGMHPKCICGGFNATTSVGFDAYPLLSQEPGLEVDCVLPGDEGIKTCKSLCNALAIATKAKGPEVLCNRLQNTHELKLSAFAKVCDSPWVYADVTADEPLCCEDSKAVRCPSALKSTATGSAVV